MKRMLCVALSALPLLACVDTPNSRTSRFDGPIAPCDVKLTGESEPADARDSEDQLWQDGPWAVWNTHPDVMCNTNPTAPTRNVVQAEGEEDVETTFDMEMYITYPVAADPTKTGVGDVAGRKFPVLIFAHANNDRVCEIFESYYSLQDHWASWGWVVVSVDGTRFNCRRGTKLNIELRAESMVSALDRLKELNADPESRFYERLDLDNVVLAGHSRGGGAAFVAAWDIPETIGIMTIQGVDTQAFGFGSDIVTTLPTLGLTAGNDVDLNYPHVEIQEGILGGRYAWADIQGGIHAYTADNAPLEPDDVPGITREEQHNVTELFTTALMFDVLGDPRGESILYSLEGNTIGSEISELGVFHRWRKDVEPTWIDTFDRINPAENELGGVISFEGFTTSQEVSTYKPADNPPSGRYATSTSLLLSTEGDGVFRTEVGVDAALDVSDTPVLYFKAKGPDDGATAPFDVAFVTSAGTDVVEIEAEHFGPIDLANRQTQFVVPVPNPAAVEAIEFRVGPGTIMLDDLRFDR